MKSFTIEINREKILSKSYPIKFKNSSNIAAKSKINVISH